MTQEQIAKIVATIILSIICNCGFRGGYIEKWFPNFRGGKAINAIVFGAWCGYLAMSWVFGPVMALCMYAGQSFPLFSKHTDHAREDGHWLEWAVIVLERGAVWVSFFVPVSVYFFGTWAAWWIMSAVMMPVAYSWEWTKLKLNRWALCEATYAPFLWLPVPLMVIGWHS